MRRGDGRQVAVATNAAGRRRRSRRPRRPGTGRAAAGRGRSGSTGRRRGGPRRRRRRGSPATPGEVKGDPDGRRARAPERLDRQPVPEQQVVHGAEPPQACRTPGACSPVSVTRNAEHHGSLSVVQCAPDHRAQRSHGGVLGEPVGRVAVGPTAASCNGLRQVPVVERDTGSMPASSSASTSRS